MKEIPHKEYSHVQTETSAGTPSCWGNWCLLIAFILLAIVTTVSWQMQGIVYQLTRSDISAEEKVAALQLFFDSCGFWAPLAYVVFVTIEVVVAPIPGLMLYAPGGLIFGPLLGGFLALVGNVLGAGIACRIARSLASRWIQTISENQTFEKIEEKLESRGGWIIFWLRLNPLTSSDLVSYAAGLLRIPTWQVMVATAGGMAPLCFLQSWMSKSVFTAFPNLIYPLLAACAVYIVVVLIVLKRML